MRKNQSLSLMDRMPANPAYEPLNLAQLEYLTDKIVMAHGDPEVAEALILLMDEIERLALSEPLDVEPVTVLVKHHGLLPIKRHREPSASADHQN